MVMSLLRAEWRMSAQDHSGVPRYGRGWLASLLVMACSTAMTPATRPATQPSAPAGRDFTRIEAELLSALNTARTHPLTVAAWLDELSRDFTGTRLKRPAWPIPVQTTEGVAAVREAIAALRAQPPLPALTLSAALTSAARDQANDLGRTGATSHPGSDGSTVTTRVARYAVWKVSLSENIDYAPMMSGRDVVESLVVDDGVPDRGHRRNIYEPSSRFVGIACGPHPKYTATCVIVQAGGVTAK
jgi:uncharacterized protein YkwD